MSEAKSIDAQDVKRKIRAISKRIGKTKRMKLTRFFEIVKEITSQ